MKSIYLLLLCCIIASKIEAQLPVSLANSSDIELEALYENSIENSDLKQALAAISLLQERKEKTQDESYFRTAKKKAKTLRLLKRYEEAQKLLENTIELAANKAINPSILYALKNELGAIFIHQKQLEQALGFYEKIEAAAKKDLGPKDLEYIRILLNLGMTYYRKNNIEEAIRWSKEGIQLLKANTQAQQLYIEKISFLAQMYSRQRKFDVAESLLNEALDACNRKTISGQKVYAQVLNSMAILHARKGAVKEADRYFLKNIEWNTRIYGENGQETIKVILNRVSLFVQMKKYEEAEAVLTALDQAQIEASGNTLPELIRVNEFLGIIHTELQRPKKASEAFERMLPLSESLYGKEHFFYAGKLQNYLTFKNKQDSSYKGQIVLEKILDAISPDLKSPIAFDEKLIPSLAKIEVYDESTFIIIIKYWAEEQGRKYESTKDIQFLKRRVALCNVALDRLYRRRQTAVSRKDQLRALKESEKLVNALIQNLYELYNFSKESSYLSAAFGIAERSKSMLLSDALREEKARSMGNLPDDLAKEELRLNDVHDQLIKEMLQLREEAAIQEKRAEINKLNQEIETFQANLKNNYPNYFELKYAKTILTIEEARKQLKQEEALIEYCLTSEYIYVIYIDQHEEDFVQLKIGNTEIDNNIPKLRKALSDYVFIQQKPKEAYALYLKTAYWMYFYCLKPVLEGKKGIKRLNIIADGSFSHIPFEALLTVELRRNDEMLAYEVLPYLLNSYEVRYNYSASLLQENLNNKNTDRNTRMLGMAASYKADALTLLKEKGLERSADQMLLRKALKDLPAAQKEVENISTFIEGDFYYGEHANEKTLKKKAASCGILHLAMHGLLDEKHPLLSSLAFTENGDRTEDNFLQAYEISKLDLQKIQLVVLSACETGYGKFEHGEGVMSLARSFMYAGAPALLVSLWQVNDASTAIIMESYYQHLKMGLDKAAALQQSKVNYVAHTHDLAAHPAFWAPFIQLGDTRPVFESSRIPMWAWGLGILLVLLLGLGWKARRK